MTYRPPLAVAGHPSFTSQHCRLLMKQHLACMIERGDLTSSIIAIAWCNNHDIVLFKSGTRMMDAPFRYTI